MADIIDFNNRSRPTNDNNKKEDKKLVKHEFEVTFIDGATVKRTGFLSLGPVFAAIVDDQDMIELVINTELIRSISKGAPVEEVQLELTPLA